MADNDRHVVLLSRRPLKAVTTHQNLKFNYFGAVETVKSGLLEATVATTGGDVAIFTLHLKSRYTQRSEDPSGAIRRTGEVTAIRNAMLKRFPTPAETRFVVFIDCNDGKSSKALEHLQKRGKTEIAVLLPAADSRGDTWTHTSIATTPIRVWITSSSRPRCALACRWRGENI